MNAEHEYALSERKRGAADELYGALKRMVKAHEDLSTNTDGQYPPLDPSCPDCTGGTVPDDRNRGLCAYHFAEMVLRKIDRGQG